MKMPAGNLPISTHNDCSHFVCIIHVATFSVFYKWDITERGAITIHDGWHY